MTCKASPKPGQVWQHTKNKKHYFVYGIQNAGNPMDDDNNPPIILYMDGAGKPWARAKSAWHKSFEYIGNL